MKANVCVDYLSYNWTSSEIILAHKQVHKQQSKLSFNQITKKHSHSQKLKLIKEQNHLARYQNALWRQMSITKRIDPSLIDWQKECDITWLYGPLYLSHDSNTSSSSSSSSYNNNNNNSLKSALKKYDNSPSRPSIPCFLANRIPYDSRSEPGRIISVRFNPKVKQVEYMPEAPPIDKGTIETKTEQKEEEEEDEEVQMTQSVTSAIKVILLDKITMMSSQSTSIRVCASIIWVMAWFIYQMLYFLTWSQRQLMNNIATSTSCESHN